ncbi:MAG: dTMP kinase [Candidatus Velthaea sp.]
MLITFEGIEGSGKSTLIAALAEMLRVAGTDVLVTREPGGSGLGDALRDIFLDPAYRIEPIAEAFLINAGRAQHVAERIAPALRAGTLVLCDRFFDATVAYQGYGRGLDIEMLLRLSLAATNSIAPDLTFLLDIPVELSSERVRSRGDADRLEVEGYAFHARVRAGYLELANRFPRFVVLDGTQAPHALAEEAHAAIARRRHAAPL